MFYIYFGFRAMKKLLLILMIFPIVSFNKISLNNNIILLSDPTVLEDKGKYYLYGTRSGGSDKTNDGFLVYESTNLIDWEAKGYALKKGDAYGNKGFWSPQVFKNGEFYVMAYTANEKIAIASSKSPLGPFKNSSKTYFKSDFKEIDPYIFFDNGKIYLYRVRRIDKTNQIYVSELNKNLSIKKNNSPSKCFIKYQSWEDPGNIGIVSNQGPSVTKIGGVYYMFYSANSFRSIRYAVGYAKSPTPIGPWVKSKNNPIIDFSKINQNGPGHGDIFYDHQEKSYKYVLHTHFSKSRLRPRKTGILNLVHLIKSNEIAIRPETFKFLKSQ